MALVEKFHVVAAERDVASGETIKEGQIVALNTSGEVVLQGASFVDAYGIAGDTKSSSASAMPGISSGWQNRVSDYYDETKSSGKMTVYHSGGEFATDQFASNVSSATVGDLLYAANGVLDTVDQAGDDVTTAGVLAVARLTQAAGTYPSGVPGIDINGDQALSGENTNTYIEFKLLV
jgi:hypothetical protein